MKNLFILTITIISSLLFIQCKKSEILTEQVISTEKSLSGSDILNGTTWAVLSMDSDPNSVEIDWNIKHPKLTFNNGIIEMKLGLDLCTKQYSTTESNVTVTGHHLCPITNPNHQQLYNLFEGEFKFRASISDPNEMFLKSINGTVLTLRKINSLTTSNTVDGIIVE